MIDKKVEKFNIRRFVQNICLGGKKEVLWEAQCRKSTLVSQLRDGGY